MGIGVGLMWLPREGLRGGVVWALALLIGWGTAGSAEEQQYTVQPGDVLELYVIGVPELSRRVAISPDGMASVPLIGDVAAGGRTLQDLTGEVRTKLSRMVVPRQAGAGFEDPIAFTAPQVGLVVAEYRPIYVVGHVTRPGEQPFRVGMTARHALAAAGGPPGPDPSSVFSVATDYAATLTELAREESHLLILRVEDEGRPIVWEHGNVAADLEMISEEALRLEVRRYGVRQEALAAENAFLTEAAAVSQRRLQLLEDRRANEAESLDLDQQELDRASKLLTEGLGGATNVSDARRNLLLTATRLLQTESSIAASESDIMELQRRKARLEEGRRQSLLDEMKAVEAKVAGLQARLARLAQQMAMGPGKKIDDALVTVYRRDAEGGRLQGASLDVLLKPSDVVEVHIVLAPGVLAPTH